MDENPYKAPQTLSENTQERKTASRAVFAAVISVAGSLAAARIISYYSFPVWMKYVSIAVLGVAFFLVTTISVKKLSEHPG
jgi:hypothetical protein